MGVCVCVCAGGKKRRATQDHRQRQRNVSDGEAGCLETAPQGFGFRTGKNPLHQPPPERIVHRFQSDDLLCPCFILFYPYTRFWLTLSCDCWFVWWVYANDVEFLGINSAVWPRFAIGVSEFFPGICAGLCKWARAPSTFQLVAELWNAALPSASFRLQCSGWQVSLQTCVGSITFEATWRYFWLSVLPPSVETN